MKGKYVFILWLEAIALPILLMIALPSLGVPAAITFLVIIVVLIATLGATVPQVMKEERAKQSEWLIEAEDMEKLIKKEKSVMKFFVSFFTIGIILFLASAYYYTATVASGSAESAGISSLNILGIAGALFFMLSFAPIIYWAYLRDMHKRMKEH
jgi:Na+-transporting methylmalonyl-CoA/oxaloacetate decarboxylase gamma subunit